MEVINREKTEEFIHLLNREEVSHYWATKGPFIRPRIHVLFFIVSNYHIYPPDLLLFASDSNPRPETFLLCRSFFLKPRNRWAIIFVSETPASSSSELPCYICLLSLLLFHLMNFCSVSFYYLSLLCGFG